MRPHLCGLTFRTNRAAGWAVLAVAVLFVVYGVLNQLLDRNRPHRTLQESVDWIGMKSNWTKKYRELGDNWVTYLRRDLLDALGTGQIRARGRKPFSSGISLNGAQPIPAEFWPNAQINLTHAIDDNNDALAHVGSGGRSSSRKLNSTRRRKAARLRQAGFEFSLGSKRPCFSNARSRPSSPPKLERADNSLTLNVPSHPLVNCISARFA